MQYLSIDSDLLDVMITWDQTGSHDVSKLQEQAMEVGGEDWMTMLLQIRPFTRYRLLTFRRLSSECSKSNTSPVT